MGYNVRFLKEEHSRQCKEQRPLCSRNSKAGNWLELSEPGKAEEGVRPERPGGLAAGHTV